MTDRKSAAVANVESIVQYVDPRTLTASARNTRADLGNLGELSASIAASGVLEPLVVARADEATVILAGHRRAAAAIAAGVQRVPVIYRDDLAADIEQLTVVLSENLHRRGLSDVEVITAVQQMIELGESGASIARRTGISKTRTTRLARVARSTDEVRQAVSEHDLTLDQALALDEVKDDPEELAALVDVVDQPGQFDALARRYRAEKKIAKDITDALATYAEEGITAYAEDAVDRPDSVRLTDIYGWGQSAQERVDAHAECSGRVVVLSAHVWQQSVRAEERCADPQQHPEYVEAEKERADRMAQYEQAQQGAVDDEDKKAQRRRVIANNKAMDASNAHRIAWLAQLLASKRPALGKNPATMIARLYAERGRLLGDSSLHTQSALEAVGWKHGEPTARAQAATGLGYLFALIAAATENSTDREVWRQRGSIEKHAAWVRALIGLGYEPTGIERAMVEDRIDTYPDGN
ncbi:MAG: ParB/RepB/Spo0J family partition protein [Cumulibacter sp.]